MKEVTRFCPLLTIVLVGQPKYTTCQIDCIFCMENQLLFSVSHEFQTELDKGIIPKALQQKFADNNITFVDISKTWQIKKDQQTFTITIREEENKLSIYQNECAFITSTKALKELMQSKTIDQGRKDKSEK